MVNRESEFQSRSQEAAAVGGEQEVFLLRDLLRDFPEQPMTRFNLILALVGLKQSAEAVEMVGELSESLAQVPPEQLPKVPYGNGHVSLIEYARLRVSHLLFQEGEQLVEENKIEDALVVLERSCRMMEDPATLQSILRAKNKLDPYFFGPVESSSLALTMLPDGQFVLVTKRGT